MRLKTLLGVIALVMLMLAGCSSTAAQSEKPPLKIGWSQWAGWYPLILADKLGLFEKRGIEVEPVYYEIASDTNIDYVAGKLDGALVTAFDVLPINARGARDRSPVVMVTDNTVEGDAILATPDIRTPADLKGKTLAVAFDSYAEVLLRAMLQKYGLSAEDVHLVDIPPEEVPAQLGKTIDAGHTYAPFISEAVKQGQHVIFTGAETPGLLLDVMIMRESALKERPDNVRALIDAFFEAQEWWRQNRLKGNSIIAEATGQRVEDVNTEGLRLYDRNDNLKAFTDPSAADSLYNSLNGNLQYLLDSGTLNSRPDLNPLMDSSFLK